MSANVVSFSEAERSRRVGATGTPTGAALADSRAFVIERLRSALRSLKEPLHTRLLGEAETSFVRSEREIWLTAAGLVHSVWIALAADFIAAFGREFDDRVQRREAGQPPEPDGPSELSLVEDRDLSFNLALSRAAKLWADLSADELWALEQRYAALAGQTSLECPVAPTAIAASLASALERLPGGKELGERLLLALQEPLGGAIENLYRELNARLVDSGVLPNLKRSYRRTSASFAQAAVTSVADNDLGRLLEQWVSAKTGRASTVMVGDASPAPQAGAVPVNAAALGAGPMSALSGVPAGARAAGVGIDALALSAAASTMIPSDNATLPTATLSALTALQAVPVEPMSTAVLQAFRTSGAGQQLAPLDAAMVDIVAMLFDFIFEDSQVDDALKAQIGRLQIPVLKAAMLDHGFFASRSHPVRRLLDVVSRLAVMAGGVPIEQDPCHARLVAAVNRVLDEFDRELGLFGELADELAHFITAQESAAEARAARSQAMVAMRELDEQAELAARSVIMARIDNALHPVLTDFLRGPWRRALAIVHRYDGDAAFAAAIATTDTLLWSVQPKPSSADRQALIGKLPELLRALHAALDRIDLPIRDRQGLLDTLVALHSCAIKNSLTTQLPEAIVPTPVLADGARAATPVVHASLQSGDVELEHIHLDLSQTTLRPALADDARALVAALRRGDWMELWTDEGRFVRARLTWISPQRGIFLFASPQLQRAISVSPEALALQVERDLARRLDGEPLFERAVESVVGELRDRVAAPA